MELIALLLPIFGFVLIRAAMEQRAKERAKKLEALKSALENPALDRATLTQLTHQLTGTRPPRKPGRAMAWLLGLGWLTLFSGVGLYVMGEFTGQEYVSAPGMMVSLIGFGLVTYPFALRELESRRPAA